MKKSTVIAQCLVNAGMTLSILSGEREVERVFLNEFGDEDFEWWNGHVADPIAQKLVRNTGPATRIHIDRLIQDLWSAA